MWYPVHHGYNIITKVKHSMTIHLQVTAQHLSQHCWANGFFGSLSFDK